MPGPQHGSSTGALLQAEELALLFQALVERGYDLIGPTVEGDTLVLSAISSPTALPAGWADRQDAGAFRLVRRNDNAFFGHNLGQHSWRQHLFLPGIKLFGAVREGGTLAIVPPPGTPVPRMAFIGARACDLQALHVHDLLFLEGEHADPHYAARRRAAFIVAVNCTTAGGTCFCASMGTGPRCTHGFDVVLTELLDKDRHVFLADAGSARGEALLAALPLEPARPEDRAAAERAIADAAAAMGRTMETEGIKELLQENQESPEWDDVAARCFGCTNCTLVCPTCFCATIEDFTDLSGGRAERVRRWDSCFSREHSYIHGGSIRHTLRARYRQWLTHKLAHWYDQFGLSGCVGCGRCITWCPARIDITEEVRAIRRFAAAARAKE